MADNKTSEQARSALGVDASAFDLVDALKQQYITQKMMGEQAVPTARQYYWACAVLADVLSTYYQSQGDEDAAETWSTRAIRFWRRSQGKNAIAQNIGAKMP